MFVTLKKVSFEDVINDTPISDMESVYTGTPENSTVYAVTNGFTRKTCKNVFGYYYVKNAGEDNCECLLPDIATPDEVAKAFEQFNKIEKAMESYQNESPLVVSMMRRAIERFNLTEAAQIDAIYETVYHSVGDYPEDQGWGTSDTSILMNSVKEVLEAA